MFTGIIEHVGTVESLQQKEGALRLGVRLGPLVEDLKLGDSVAINGVCLTATTLDGPTVGFDVVEETMTKTSLGTLRVGSRANTELALRVGDRLGGHMVQGHIERMGRVAGIREDSTQIWLTIGIDTETEKEMLKKGSITVDGVSLTVADLGAREFSVAIIPHTWSNTNLSDRRIGDRVNLETDVVGQWVRKLIGPMIGENERGIDIQRLRDEGFLPGGK